ncbi:MAG: NUDIX domain-containing protein [Chloroflexota bacterium]|nr:NUDIX domain-containing protein [Chloroflexota bacterium]
MSRKYPSHPLVGVAAVVLRDRQVLLILRGKEPAKGLWGLPGGLLELGETLAQGARREIQEECNIIVEPGPVVGVFEPMDQDGDGRWRYHFVVVDLLARYVSGDLQAGDDAADARWVALEAMDELPMTAETQDIIWKAVGMSPSS